MKRCRGRKCQSSDNPRGISNLNNERKKNVCQKYLRANLLRPSKPFFHAQHVASLQNVTPGEAALGHPIKKIDAQLSRSFVQPYHLSILPKLRAYFISVWIAQIQRFGILQAVYMTE